MPSEEKHLPNICYVGRRRGEDGVGQVVVWGVGWGERWRSGEGGYCIGTVLL